MTEEYIKGLQKKAEQLRAIVGGDNLSNTQKAVIYLVIGYLEAANEIK